MLYYTCRYKITEDLIGNKYVVDMSASVCYEDGASCEEDFVIFSGAEFTRKTCTYKDGFLNSGNTNSVCVYQGVPVCKMSWL